MSATNAPVCEDNIITHGDQKYGAFLPVGEGHYFNGRTLWLDVEPGESPRAVLDGFVYGRHAFLPEYAESNKADQFAAQHASEMVSLDAHREREARNARSIPAKHHARVNEWSLTMNQRAIARKLEEELGVKTSHASVGRLVRQLRIAAVRASQRAELMEDVTTLRVQLNQTFETILDQQADLLEQQQSPGAPDLKQIPVALRAHQVTAGLLERRLRNATRDLAAIGPADGTDPHLNGSERGREALPGNPPAANVEEDPAAPIPRQERLTARELDVDYNQPDRIMDRARRAEVARSTPGEEGESEPADRARSL